MSRAALRCSGCGGSNIVEDALYCQAQQVCVDCGSVVSEDALASESVYVGGSDVSYSRSTAGAKKPCMNLIIGVQRVISICRILRVNSEIEKLAQVYYQQAYQHESFIRVSLQKKEHLAGCCLLVSCRLLNWPISMATISCLLDADTMVMGMLYIEMIKVLNIKAPIVNITDVMEAHSHDYQISSLHVPEELAESHKVLTQRAVELVELAADSWIVTGRRPIPIMMAAIYLSWQSLKPNKHRLKLSLEKFCHLAKVSKHRPATMRLAEMKEMLCKLGREIPWVREAVTPGNVVKHVEDILKHRYALLRRALRAREDALLAEGQASCEELPTKEDAPAHISELGDQNPNASSVELKAERTQRPADGDHPELPRETLKGPEPAANWGKRVLFAPPCVLQAKRSRAEQPERTDVTGDEDISDSEIDTYIRTPQEAREFALTQKMLSE
ncbi:Transcription factor IIIB subunit [Liparis tanakae]|uniref:Transcription factor IIIB 50 kDa subunit n=1 Tax=Liparis tanakae TaxID=230148 RepID=A0A4Z2I6V1_9TELE|nr:Transcription factor IIIB subunit [Liparis tanakae]